MITEDEIIKITELSKLTLDSLESIFYQTQLSRIINYVKELDSIPDLDSAEEKFPCNLGDVDEPVKFLETDLLIPKSKSDEEGFFICGKEW